MPFSPVGQPGQGDDRFAAARHPGLKVNPARIDGGGPNNVVPDKAVLRINFRPATPEDQAHALGLIEGNVGDVAAGP